LAHSFGVKAVSNAPMRFQVASTFAQPPFGLQANERLFPLTERIDIPPLGAEALKTVSRESNAISSSKLSCFIKSRQTILTSSLSSIFCFSAPTSSLKSAKSSSVPRKLI
jgi:hypothetical protein